MVQLGGFDLHYNLVGRQPGKLQAVSEAMTAFHAATVELGVADKVTSFTASDFGRTMSSNCDGSDHGWGSHHFVRWFGVEAGELNGILPNLRNFGAAGGRPDYPTNLGFMRS